MNSYYQRNREDQLKKAKERAAKKRAELKAKVAAQSVLDQWHKKLDAGTISFVRISNFNRDMMEMTWGTYLSNDAPLERPTQLKVRAKTYKRLIEKAIERENIVKESL